MTANRRLSHGDLRMKGAARRFKGGFRRAVQIQNHLTLILRAPQAQAQSKYLARAGIRPTMPDRVPARDRGPSVLGPGRRDCCRSHCHFYCRPRIGRSRTLLLDIDRWVEVSDFRSG